MFAFLVILSLSPIGQPGLKCLGVVNKHGSDWIGFQVENPNNNRIFFYGYTPESFSNGIPKGEIIPFYLMEIRKNNGPWKQVELGHCGTGKGILPLEPKSKVTFETTIPAGEWDEVRVGLAWAKETSAPIERAWSDVIKRADLKNKKP